MEEENTYYNYEEEKDTLPLEPNQPNKSNAAIWLIWLRIWITPRAGWKALKHSRVNSDRFAATCFYPIIALAAAGAFITQFYHTDASISDMLRKATEVFISFFLSYFAFPPLVGLIPKMPKKSINSDFGKNYAAMLLSSLAFFYFLLECLPFLEPAFAFTPLYTIFLAYKGTHALRLSSQDIAISLSVICIAIIGMPLLLSYIFNLIMPQ